MNPHEETDMDGDIRLTNAWRELLKFPEFNFGEELARANRARMADDSWCPTCGKRGVTTCNCERG